MADCAFIKLPGITEKPANAFELIPGNPHRDPGGFIKGSQYHGQKFKIKRMVLHKRIKTKKQNVLDSSMTSMMLSETSQNFNQEEDLGPISKQQIINKRWSAKPNEAKLEENGKMFPTIQL